MSLSSPDLATFAVFSFMTQWHASLWPMIVTQSEGTRTLTVGLRSFQDELVIQFIYLTAGTVMSIVPALVLFLALQRYFVRGIAMTGMGGR